MPATPFATRWRNRFAFALRGVRVAVLGGEVFAGHAIAAVLVIALGWWLQVTQAEWLLLTVCITAVFAAELFNSAIEHLARAVTRDEHPEIRDALDIAAGAVLVVAIGAKVVGLVVLGPRLLGG